jgi:hypothetical protein
MDDDAEDRSALRIRLIWLALVVVTVVVIAGEFTYLHFRGASNVGLSHHIHGVLHSSGR